MTSEKEKSATEVAARIDQAMLELLRVPCWVPTAGMGAEQTGLLGSQGFGSLEVATQLLKELGFSENEIGSAVHSHTVYHRLDVTPSTDSFSMLTANPSLYEWLNRQTDENETKPTVENAIIEWDKSRSQLFLNGVPIRQVKNLKKAHRIVALLDAFQRKNWDGWIENPFDDNVDFKLLSNTISSLNVNCKPIRFFADGKQKGVHWELS